jgi:dTDP-glucose pyrophosphorylase
MIGLIPAAGAGERIQPLGCSKELLPVGARKINGIERPKAVAEYLVERMIAAGAEEICMVISAEKSDIVRYFAARDFAAEIFYVVQRRPQGLCDALFRAEPFARRHDQVLIGLPDTIWFPENAYRPALDFSAAEVNLVLFPVQNPSAFDAVVAGDQGYVTEVEVKRASAHSHWIWGAITSTGGAFSALKQLWQSRHRSDVYMGDLFNAYIAAGNLVRGIHCGEVYMDVGTLEGYHRAQDYLRQLQALSSHGTPGQAQLQAEGAHSPKRAA